MHKEWQRQSAVFYLLMLCVGNVQSMHDVARCGSRDGAVVRALAFHQSGPGSIPDLGAICGLSFSSVLVPTQRVFLRVLRFSSLHKNQHFQIPIRPGNSGWKSHPVESTKIPIFSYSSRESLRSYYGDGNEKVTKQ